jgi:hypothetical protein
MKVFLFLTIIFFIIWALFISVNIWESNVTKKTLGDYFPKQNVLNTFSFDPKNISKINFPCIIKPTICSGTNRNVKLLHNIKELEKYIKESNKNENYIIQEFFYSKYEIGVLYEKIPFLNSGKVISIVLKKSNSSMWKPLKCGNINNLDSTTCIDLTEKLANSNFVKHIINISNSIPNFFAGRYDIGFNSFDDLDSGVFKIYELNGVMGFDLRSNIELNEKFSWMKIYYIVRWIFTRFLIGLLNIITLKISPLYLIKKLPWTFSKAYTCNDYEHLFQSSPA